MSLRKFLGRLREVLFLVIAAAALLFGGVVLFYTTFYRIPLERTGENIQVRYALPWESYSEPDALKKMKWMTEDELLGGNKVIFRGTVVDTENIVIDLGSEKLNRAVLKIRVDEIIKGDLVQGNIIQILSPCPVGEGVFKDTSLIASQMTAGTRGIFMPTVYTDTSVMKSDVKSLYLKDLADYGFSDGMRYAFLDLKGRLVFDRDAYPSIEDAQTMEDIEIFIHNELDL